MLGYEVAEFLDGHDALKHFSDVGPDLAIVDQGLPDIQGIDLGRQIRDRESGDRCVLILLTGTDSQTLRVRGREAGFDDFLFKPVRIQTLQSCIESHLVK